MDGTLLEAWASLKSFRPRDDGGPPTGSGGRNPEVDFRGEKWSNDTHASTPDPEAMLARKGPGKEAKLCFACHVLMENRNGLVVDVTLTQASGTAEREAALEMLERLPGVHRVTVGADKHYDTAGFVAECREMHVTPHIAQNTSGRRSAIDGRTSRHPGYAVSQRVRKRVEEIFGWVKTVAGGRLWAELTAAAYNLVRIVKLALASPELPREECAQ